MTQHVLIVDDEPNIVLSVEFLMKRDGFRVSVARDGEEAMERLYAERPDLVILDVMMPKLDGFEVCERIRADPELADVRILMLTAKGREAEMKKGLALGADDYVAKPFSTRDLVQRVKSLLNPA